MAVSTGKILVVDIGTSSVRVAIIDGDAQVIEERHRSLLPQTPAPGLVEFDAAAMARSSIELCQGALEAHGPVDAVGIANQRASVVVWDRKTGVPVAPGIGWQDLRTVMRCLELRGQGQHLAPNQSATKIESILDLADPDRSRDLCVGTVDSWIISSLTNGELHITDGTNVAVTGLREINNREWNTELLDILRIPESLLPAVVDSSGLHGLATALLGAPPIAGIMGDQQASLLGQGCVTPGDAKITFGTGAMLDLVLDGTIDDVKESRYLGGTFPIVTRRQNGKDLAGLEAIMLAAGTNIEWLRDDMGLIASAEESAEIAATCSDTGDVWFVPALLGLGTPNWDYGARASFVGITRGTTRAHMVRAVLEGVAHRGADLVDAAEADSKFTIARLRIDGGMSANPVFVSALASATQRPVEISPVREATTLGAAFSAGLAVGIWSGDEEIAATWRPTQVIEPGSALNRDRWSEAVQRSENWIPALSGLEF